MAHQESVKCPHCKSTEVKKNGKNSRQIQRYRCKPCGRCFQTDHFYPACEHGKRELIIVLMMNGCGIRDISRSLTINIGTVVNNIKKKAIEVQFINEGFLKQNKIEDIEILICEDDPDDDVGNMDNLIWEDSLAIDYQPVISNAEADEQWSFVEKKSNPVWLWYAIDKKTGVILAFTFGRRTDEIGKKLCKMLESFDLNRIYTDGWATYAKYISKEQHLVSKADTQKIERKNLTIRTHIKRLQRKTICFSKSLLMHQTVIGLYINKKHFQVA